MCPFLALVGRLLILSIANLTIRWLQDPAQLHCWGPHLPGRLAGTLDTDYITDAN